MASQTEIINTALRKLGEKRIAALTDNTRSARLAADTFDHFRDVVLRAHTWNFATHRATLAASSTAPDWGYTNSFPFPESPKKCLRMVEVNGESQDEANGKWKVEGRAVVTNLTSPIEVRYIWKNVDYGDYDPLFDEALACRLAKEWAIDLTKRDSLKVAMDKDYLAALADARSVDGQEGTPEDLSNSSWINARWSG